MYQRIFMVAICLADLIKAVINFGKKVISIYLISEQQGTVHEAGRFFNLMTGKIWSPIQLCQDQSNLGLSFFISKLTSYLKRLLIILMGIIQLARMFINVSEMKN